MKKKFFFFIAFSFLFVIIFSLNAIQTGAEDVIPSDEIDLSGASCFAVYNIETGKYVISKNANYSVAPASTAKIMSGLVVCELLEARADEWITITAEMLSGSSGKSFGLATGQRIKVKSLMIAAFSGGYNDAVTVLANLCGGNTSGFVQLMNKRAEMLGLTSTVYKNPTGLDEAGMKTSLDDIVKLASVAAENKLFLEVCSYFTASVTFGDGRVKTVYSSNLLLSENSPYYCRSVKGMSSGMTDWGGACLVTYGEHAGSKYIAVALGCADDESRFELVQNSLDFVYNNYSYITLIEKGISVGKVPVSLAVSSDSEAKLILAEDLRIYCSKNENINDLTFSLMLPYDSLKAPISTEENVAIYTVWKGSELLGYANVKVERNIERSMILLYIDSVRDYICGRAFIATVIILVICGLGAIILPYIALKIRQRRRRYIRQRGGFHLNK